MNRTISLCYSQSKTPEQYLDLFRRLMSDNSFIVSNDKNVSEQLITLDGLKEAVSELQSTLSTSEHIDIETLDPRCVETLTRVVDYRKLVFERPDSRSRVVIKMSKKNDFPVLGIELWNNGTDSLPGGMFSISSEDEKLTETIATSVLEFKSEKPN